MFEISQLIEVILWLAFQNEAMTGTHTQNPVYSRLTFALLEDSGWYKANYRFNLIGWNICVG